MKINRISQGHVEREKRREQNSEGTQTFKDEVKAQDPAKKIK